MRFAREDWSSNISVLLAMLEQPSTAVRDGVLVKVYREERTRAAHLLLIECLLSEVADAQRMVYSVP